jgi:hypothetical protein
MRVKRRHNGSVFLIVIFLASLMSVLVMGMLQINTEELQLMRNQINAAESLATAEAGLNHAFAELRDDNSWTAGFTGTSFNGGSYTVTVSGTAPNLTIESTGTSAQSFETRIEADVTIATSGPPYVIRIDSLRINE